MKTDLEKSRQWLLVSGLLVVAGAIMFFSAADTSGPAYVPVVTVSPTAATGPHGGAFADGDASGDSAGKSGN